jgi:threonylcarbamoyladenosine tRNA methylthiotransferase CDKAL1
LEANVWILNSCTVKGPSEQHFKNEVEEGRSLEKKVIVSGCVPQSDPRSNYIKGLSIIGVKQIDEIVTVVEEVLKGNTIRLLSFKKKNGVKNPPGASLHFPKIRKNELIEIIPVSTGCLNSCTYCKTKLARGNLSSYPIEEIVSRAEQVIRHEGVKEIW